MSRIDELTEQSAVADADLFPIWSHSSEQPRSVTAEHLFDYFGGAAQDARIAIDSRFYPGVYTSAPTTRPDGTAMRAGDEYFSAITSLSYRYNGAAWVASDLNTANLAASSGSSLVGYTQGGAGAIARTVQTKLRDVVSVADFGAIGDNTTDDSAAIQAALDYWRTTASCTLVFPPKKFKIGTGLTATFTAADVAGKTIMGHGAQLVSNLASGYMLTIASQAVFRYLSIEGLQLTGGASESGCLKIDGGLNASSQFLYGFKLDGVKCDNFNGNGVYITGNAFEGALYGVQARALGANITGTGILVDNGVGGVVSSVDLYGCMTVNGLRGLRVVSPTSDVKVYGGTFIQAQQEGVLLESGAGTVVHNCHIENNWQGAANLAAGGPGLKVIGSAYLCGVAGTTNAKQKYVVGVFATAAQPAYIIGGNGAGLTVQYAYIDGATGAEVWVLSNNTFDVSGTSVVVHQMGKGLTIGGGTSKGRKALANNAADYQDTVYRWSGSGTAYFATRFASAAAGRFDVIPATASADIGAEAYGSPVISYQTGNKLSFYNAAPITKPAVSGSRGANAALASLITQLATLGLVTDSSSV